MTHPIGSDKIPTPTTDQRPSRPQGAAREDHQSAPSAGAPPGPRTDRSVAVERASQLYAQQRADAAAGTALSDPVDALALAQRLRQAMQSAPAAASAAHSGVKQIAVEAALAAPAT